MRELLNINKRNLLWINLKDSLLNKGNESTWLKKINEKQEFKYIFKGGEYINNPSNILSSNFLIYLLGYN